MCSSAIRAAGWLYASLLVVSIPVFSIAQTPKRASSRPVFEGTPKPSLPYQPIPTAKETSPESDLLVAALEGDISQVDTLLQAGTDPDTKGTPNGATPLHWAVVGGFLHIVELLLGKGANLDAQDAGGASPLHLAVELGLASAMEILIKADANLELRRSDGATPLILAAATGQVVATELLLEAGSKVDAKDDNGWTALMVASGHHEVISVLVAKVLIDSGAKADARSKTGRVTALHAAAAAGGVASMARELIRAGANLNAQDSAGFTPLAAAAYFGHSTLVFLLAESGADRSVATAIGERPLDVVCGCVDDGNKGNQFCDRNSCQDRAVMVSILAKNLISKPTM